MTSLLSPRVLTVLVLLFGFFLLAFSAFIQDLGWLLWGAEVSLTGGELYRDFVEMNAPMILVLNFIPQAVTEATGINAVITYDAFIALLLAASLFLTRHIYRTAERADEAPPWSWALPVLLLGYVVFAPAIKSWGQREFITAMLVMPYVALAHERIHLRAPSRLVVVLAALACAIGIGIKPHFLLPLAAIEVVVLRQLGFRRTIRLELIVVGVALTAYLLLSFMLVPEYFRLMRDLGGSDAYAAFRPSELKAAMHFGTMYGVMAILISLAVPSRPAWVALRRLLVWLTAGFILSAVAQQKGFDYHLIPTIIFGTALLALVLSERAARRPVILLATAICVFVMAGKVASRTLRTVKLVVARPGTALSTAVDVIETYAPRGRVVGISLHLAPLVPATTYADVDWGSAFSTVWPLITAYEDQRTGRGPIRYHTREEMRPLERYMFDQIVTDITTHPPDLIVFRRLLTDELYGDGRFSYIQYFSRDERFRSTFSNYRRLPIDDNLLIWYARSDIADKAFDARRAHGLGTRWSHNCYNCLD